MFGCTLKKGVLIFERSEQKFLGLTLCQIGFFFFLFTCASSLFIQTILLPKILPTLHGGNGLLANTDAVRFHQIAKQLSEEMHTHGWAHWKLLPPEGGLPSGIAAIFYYILVPEPYALIPVNALIHSISAICLVLIFLEVGFQLRQAIMGSLPFLLFPSAASWYAQIHRDGYCFLGVFLILLAYLKLAKLAEQKMNGWTISKIYLGLYTGGLVVSLSRDYVLQILSNIFPILVALVIGSYLLRLRRKTLAFKVVPYAIVVCLMTLFLPKLFDQQKFNSQVLLIAPSDVRDEKFKKETQSWNSSGLPAAIENSLFRLAVSRDAMRYRPHTEVGSHLDEDVRFQSIWDIVKYLPRAIEIAVLAPFPNTWFREANTRSGRWMRLMSAFEMCFVYIALCSLLFCLSFLIRKIQFWVIFIPCSALLLIYALGTNNIGALYRYRFGYLMVLVGLGFACLDSRITNQKWAPTEP